MSVLRFWEGEGYMGVQHRIVVPQPMVAGEKEDNRFRKKLLIVHGYKESKLSRRKYLLQHTDHYARCFKEVNHQNMKHQESETGRWV